MRTRSALLLTTAMLCLAASSVRAVTLDWDTATWTSQYSNSFDVDPAKAGSDITVAVSGSTTRLTTGLVAPNPATPAITAAFQGGMTSIEKSLEIALDLTTRTEAVTIAVSFSALYTQGVQNVSFTIFDIDFSNASSSNSFQDELRSIVGLSTDGVTQVAPTITTSANNSKTGSGLSQVVDGNVSTVDTGTGSGSGNVTISFAGPIKSFTFDYGSGSGTQTNPTYQHMGLGDITFTPVPEMNPAWTALATCLAVSGLVLHHRARVRKQR